LRGHITDPRSLQQPYPRMIDLNSEMTRTALLEAPLPAETARSVELVKGPNIRSLPEFEPLPDTLELPVLLKMGDNVSTDEILPAGAKVLPYRSNIQKIEDFAFERIDPTYVERARAVRGTTGHAVVAGRNYGQGSSREHASVAPRDLGLRIVLAKGFARIHRQNLINYGVLPLVFVHPQDYDRLSVGDVLHGRDLRRAIANDEEVSLECNGAITVKHDLTKKQADAILAGSLINLRRTRVLI
jgi:aconitate hydratase